MDRNQFMNYLTTAFPKHILGEDHGQFDFVLTLSSPLSVSGVSTKDSTNNTESSPINSVLLSKKTISNYLTTASPENILGKDPDLNVVLRRRPTKSSSSKRNVQLINSTDNTVSGPNSSKTSSRASNANKTSFLGKFLPRINTSIDNLKNIQKKRNMSMNTPPEDTYNVLVVCSDENENSDYNKFRKFISDEFYDRKKKINTTFLNARKNNKRYPQHVEDAQYDNHFDMIWFAGCLLLNDIFNDRFLLKDDPLMYTVQRTYDILKVDGSVIFTEDYENRSINSEEFNPTIKVQKMAKLPTDMDIPKIFLRYFNEMEITDTGTVFYRKKHLPQPSGFSPGDIRMSSAFSSSVQPRTMTTSSNTATSMSISSSIRNSKPEKRFSDFLDDAGGLAEHMKTQLRKIFSDPDWTVYDPPGDGFCTIHAIYKDLGRNTNNKEYLVNELYRAMKTYMEKTEHEEIVVRPDVKYHTIGTYNFMNQYTANETKENLQRYIHNNALPDDIKQFYIRRTKNQTTIDTQELYNILKDSFENRTGPFKKEDVIHIEDVENVMLTKQNFQGQNEETTKEFLRSLENSNDLGTELVKYFPYITGHNILYITVDKSSNIPIGIAYYEGPRDSTKPPQNTIIFNWSGHTVLLQNTDEKKNALVKPYVPELSAQQVNKAVNLGYTSDEVTKMSRENFNEIMNPVD